MSYAENYLDVIFDEFKDKIVQANFSKSFIKSASRITLEKLNKEYGVAKEQGRESSITHMTNMICNDIISNQKIVIGFKDISIEERERTLALLHNRQYQWLLVEAFEAFEDWFSKLYVHVGLLDSELWGKEEFGSSTPSKISNRDIDWLIKAAKKKKLMECLRKLNKRIPSLTTTLTTRKPHDPLKIDYEFMVILVSEFRHQIVHTHGKTERVEFTKRVLGKNPWANRTDLEKQDYAEIISWFFGVEQLENLITLLEFRNTDRLSDLLSIVASYAMLLHNLTRRYLANTQPA